MNLSDKILPACIVDIPPKKIMMLLQNFIKQNIVVFLLLIYSSIFLFSNYATFPYFEGDEGIYISRARSFIEQGKLSPETYWYDHAPLGWIFISPFVKLLYNLNVFESYLVAGRFVIIVLNILSLFFLYRISNYFFKKKTNLTQALSAIVCILYLTSPLYVYFGKRILLDNIMVFWVLFSIYILTKQKANSANILASAVLFSISVLTKETALLFLPGFLFILFYKFKKIQVVKKYLLFLIPFFVLVSTYPLYAFIRGELFINNYFKNGGTPSLISTLVYQASRNKSNIFDINNNPFWNYLRFWFNEDSIIVGLGVFSALILLFIWLQNKNNKAGFLFILIIFQILFLMRGGVVYEFYIVPLLPFLTLSTIYLIYLFLNNRPRVIYLFIPFIFVNLYNSSLIKGVNPYTANQTKAQIETIKELNSSIDTSNLTISDSFLKADFYNKNVKSHLDVEYNSNVKNKIDSKAIIVSNIVFTKQMDWDLQDKSFIKNLIKNSNQFKKFSSDGWDVTMYKPF